MESESDSVNCLTWRGWRRDSVDRGLTFDDKNKVISLVELSSRVVAKSRAFEELECHHPPVPEDVQLRVAFWSFPRNEDDVRMYSRLANGTATEFDKAEQLINSELIFDILQIGFHLTAKVSRSFPLADSKKYYAPSVTFDRCHITTCQCTCDHSNQWCCHVIALCLKRIIHPREMKLHPPVSDSLARLKRDQLQKFVQYLISELPQQALPTAQRLLDQLLHHNNSSINRIAGAPDPTAGGSCTDDSRWVLDKSVIVDNIKKLLSHFTGRSPVAFVDVNASFTLSYTPPAALKWSNILKPLQSRQPEGIDNLLSIIKDMFSRKDPNAMVLLEILTDEFMLHHRLIILWFSVSVDQEKSVLFIPNEKIQLGNNIKTRDSMKYAIAYIMDDLALIWKLAVLDTRLSDDERSELPFYFQDKQDDMLSVISRVLVYMDEDMLDFQFAEVFLGFQDCLEACEENVMTAIKTIGGIEDFETTLHIAVDLGKSFDEMHLSHLKDSSAVIFNSEFGYYIEVGDGSYYSCWKLAFVVLDTLYFHGNHEKGTLLAEFLVNRLIETTQAMDRDKVSEADSLFVQHLMKRTLSVMRYLINRAVPNWWDLLYALGMAAFDFGCYVPKRGFVDQVKQIDCEFHVYGLLKDLCFTQCSIDSIVVSANKIIANSKVKVEDHGGICIPYIYAVFLYELLCHVDLKMPTVVRYKSVLDGCEGPDVTSEHKALGFDLAITLLGNFYPELFQHVPIYCEMIRRLKHEFALHIMLSYKTKPDKIKAIMAALLAPAKFGLSKNERGKWEQSHGESSDSLYREEEFWDATGPATDQAPSTSLSGNASQAAGSSSGDVTSSASVYTVSVAGVTIERCREPYWSEGGDSTDEDWDGENAESDKTNEETEATGAVSQPVAVPTAASADQGTKQETGHEDPALDSAVPGPSSEGDGVHEAEAGFSRAVIEAESFSLFELGKEILGKIDGTAETRPAPSSLLHLCAFDIVLFALRLHNLVSRNWMSRTNSMHGSWIEKQARDIGTSAIELLIEKWEGVLTPSEVVVIAEKVTRSNGAIARRAAARLLRTCLPQAHTLNLGSLQVAITLCKEQGPDMLERACLVIEKAAVNGGLDPSLLFLVARQSEHVHSNAARMAPSSSGGGGDKCHKSTPLITPEQYVQPGPDAGI